MEIFSHFLEHDAMRQMYGLPELKPPLSLNPEGGPIKAFGRDKLMSELTQYKIGPINGVKFLGEVRWGEGTGAVRVRLSPNFLVMVERLTEDLNGNPVWICKKTSRIKISEFSGKELTVADEIVDQVNEISNKNIDAPKEKFNIDALLKRLIEKVKRLTGPFVYETVKNSNNNSKILQFGLTGSGVGQLVRQTPASGTTPLALLEIAFLKDKGIIKSIFTTVSQDAKSGQWQIQVPYLLFHFSPTQSNEEISSIIYSGIRLI